MNYSMIEYEKKRKVKENESRWGSSSDGSIYIGLQLPLALDL